MPSPSLPRPCGVPYSEKWREKVGVYNEHSMGISKKKVKVGQNTIQKGSKQRERNWGGG
jgi:hypothetical protein